MNFNNATDRMIMVAAKLTKLKDTLQQEEENMQREIATEENGRRSL